MHVNYFILLILSSQLSNSYGTWVYLWGGGGSLLCGPIFALVESWAYPQGKRGLSAKDLYGEKYGNLVLIVVYANYCRISKSDINLVGGESYTL